MSDMKVIDKNGKWFINTAAFRMNDPTPREGANGTFTHIFESGVKYKINETEWMKGQPTIKATSEDDSAVLDEVQVPAQPGEPVLNLATISDPSTPAAVAASRKK